MKHAREWMPAALTTGTLVGTGLTLAHSLWSRGARRTVAFATLGMGLPLAGEFTAVNVVRVVRHHTHPQVNGVPLAAVAWYNIAYAAHAVVESLLLRAGVSRRARRWAVPVGTAALATSLDLILDCFGLDMGLWEWRDGGPYAREIVGPNGKAGIPTANFVGWVALTGGVSLGYELLAETGDRRSRSATAGTTAALLLAPYYLASASWAIARRKPRYLAYSALVPAALMASVMRWRRQ